MEPIKNKIYRKVRSRNTQWTFTERDFVDIGSREAIRQALVRLVKEGKIRRVMRGIYDYPEYIKVLNKQASPDLNQVAQALARKFGWRIQPSGDTALNVLGLSTQVPGRIIYLSDGPNREYLVGKRQLIFQKTLLKHAGLKHRESALVVHGLEALGEERFSPKVGRKIRSNFDEAMLKKILLDSRRVKGWIYDCIRVICLGENDG